MEKWEKEIRAHLNETLKEGLHQIGDSPFVAWTGKQGKIDFEVAVLKELREKCNITD